MHEKTYNELLKEKTSEIQKISNEIDYNNLIYYFKGPGISLINLIRYRGPLHIFNGIKNGNISLQKTGKKVSIEFKQNKKRRSKK